MCVALDSLRKCPFSARITVRQLRRAAVRFPQETLSVFNRNQRPLSARIDVRFRQESLSAFRRNWCPLSAGMSVRFGQEYADKRGFVNISKFTEDYKEKFPQEFKERFGDIPSDQIIEMFLNQNIES